MRETMLSLLLQGHDLHWDMPRSWVELQLVEDGPSEHIGQENIKRDCRGTILPGKCDARRALS